MGAFLLMLGLGLLGWLVYTAARDMAAEKGDYWQRLLAAGKYSATKLWARVVMLLGLLLADVPQLADYLGDPTLKQTITDWMTKIGPEWTGGFLVVVAIVTIMARRRSD
jgi:hypothetical protein